MTAGRPSKFRTEFVEQIRRMAEAGILDKQIARYYGVSRRVLYNWQRRWPELFEARAVKHGLKPPRRRRRFRVEFVEQARALTGLGVENGEVARLIGIARSTFTRWMHEHPTFGEAVRAGMAAAREARLSNALGQQRRRRPENACAENPPEIGSPRPLE
jgi:transposase